MMKELIRSGLEQLGLTPSIPAQAPEQLAQYGQALIEKNQVMNLTAITEPRDVATLHMLDCAPLLACGRFSGRTLIDVGTGAGFPGLALKILVPSLEVTLLDSLQKRVDFLRDCCGRLPVAARCVHGRAEEAGRDKAFREKYDVAVSRAVAPLNLLVELCLPFVRPGGVFLAMKSVSSEEETEAAMRGAALLGGGAATTWDYTLSPSGIVHRVVVIPKERPTPPAYPRRFAKMKEKPL